MMGYGSAIQCTLAALICVTSLGCQTFLKEREPVREPTRVLLLGDSITRGKMVGPQGANFAEQLHERLGPRYKVEKYACAGTTSTNWLPILYMIYYNHKIRFSGNFIKKELFMQYN